MATPLLQTKLYIPPIRPDLVSRPHLIERLHAGLRCKLTLISAPAGFGKTTLVSEWIASYRSGGPRSATAGAQDFAPRIAWLSLDESDSDLIRFLTYVTAALRTIAASVGEAVLGMLQSPQPLPAESILTALLNDLTTLHPAYLQTLGTLLYETQWFTYSLNMVFFTLGGTLFYYLIHRSRSVPRVLSLFGLIAAPLALIGTLIELFGVSVPLFVFLPNLPFELAIELWLVIMGMRDGSETE